MCDGVVRRHGWVRLEGIQYVHPVAYTHIRSLSVDVLNAGSDDLEPLVMQVLSELLELFTVVNDQGPLHVTLPYFPLSL